MIDNSETCWVLDGYGIFFQSFYGIKTELKSDGIPIGGVYGSMRTILKIINEYRPTYLFIALDTGDRTFRDTLYEEFLEKKTIKNLLNIAQNKIDESIKDLILREEISKEEIISSLRIDKKKIIEILEKFSIPDLTTSLILVIFLGLENNINIQENISLYKANRKQTPDDLKIQFPIFFEMLDSIGIPKITQKNYEADDVIASIAKKFNHKKIHTFIGSNDKDMFQLLNKKTTIFNLRQKDFITEEKFYQKFNFMPEYFIEYLSLIGDKIDNVPGINGIGEKNANSIIRKYKTVNSFLASNVDIHEVKFKKMIEDDFSTFKLSNDLIKLKDELELELDLKKFEINNNLLEGFAKKYKFNDLNEKIKDSFRKKTKET